ncbi:hypothetical protein PHLCEN_2v7252 [Hermanssonia centrifuga]|uniref:Tetrapyrrole biosynthesis uroporphyrinogen III synthase domain-containing protein n=1 Tax=Hermanssonia centrifuga TaxID=98765 RepID=A0A2R6NX22_9APHY|nr:hypothetical protein PHLCEN_2v7252 [Hermanssonia centrifuga]
MANVLLLRSPSSEEPDKYESALQSRGYSAVSVAVLETVLVNTSGLEDIVGKGPEDGRLGGVIITSARACESWRNVVLQLMSTPGISGDWSQIPFYVVGAATATALADIRKVAGSSRLAPQNIRGGSESGTSEKLAHFILQDFPSTNGPQRLLYLTGDKNRDTLPSFLNGGGIDLQSLKVYETQGSSTFASDLQTILSSVRSGFEDWWIVFFAPSAADFVAPILRRHFTIPEVDSPPTATRIAAIGPTTSTFLRDKLRMRVDVLSRKPLPEALADGIEEFDRGNSGRDHNAGYAAKARCE